MHQLFDFGWLMYSSCRKLPNNSTMIDIDDSGYDVNWDVTLYQTSPEGARQGGIDRKISHKKIIIL